MLRIDQEAFEPFNELTNTFEKIPEIHLELEHSLISIQKWESKWKKPFLAHGEKTMEELLDYIRCMTIKKAPEPEVYEYLSKDNIEKIVKYIEDPMTATTIHYRGGSSGSSNETVTAEVVYYWMLKLGIPMETEKWHFNRLWMLLQVFQSKDNPKKLSKSEAAQERMRLNAERRKKYNSKG